MDETGPYRIMPRPLLTHGEFSIRAVAPEDIESIRQWRNAQLSILRQAGPISEDDQRAYFATMIWPDKPRLEPANILVSFFENGIHVGYGGLVHLQWMHRRAEVSFLFNPDDASIPARHDHLLAAFLPLVQDLAFNDLNLHRLTTETYATRAHIIPLLEKAGFVQEGVLRQHVIKNGTLMDATLHGCLRMEAP